MEVWAALLDKVDNIALLLAIGAAIAQYRDNRQIRKDMQADNQRFVSTLLALLGRDLPHGFDPRVNPQDLPPGGGRDPYR